MFSDEKRAKTARANGLAFICSVCNKYHKGVDAGMKDRKGNYVCISKKCKGVISGGSFDDYEGPLEGPLSENMTKFCYMCGVTSPKFVLMPDFGSRLIGCCERCVETSKQLASRKSDCGSVICVSDELVGPEKFEVEK